MHTHLEMRIHIALGVSVDRIQIKMENVEDINKECSWNGVKCASKWICRILLYRTKKRHKKYETGIVSWKFQLGNTVPDVVLDLFRISL